MIDYEVLKDLCDYNEIIEFTSKMYFIDNFKNHDIFQKLIEKICNGDIRAVMPQLFWD
jgi:hypothetical protein